MEIINLNEVPINGDNHWKYPYESQQDYSCYSSDGRTRVVFRNLDDELITLIEDADVVIGCVAWLTSESILKALAHKKAVAIVVQKEDFLRPDVQSGHDWKQRLAQWYSAVPDGPSRYSPVWDGTALKDMSYGGDPTVQGIRCMGHENTQHAPACPRAHHKFLVFCREILLEKTDECSFEPYAVWTGSFNMTQNATHSLENAVVLYDAGIVRAYLKEAAQILALSEPLNWDQPWVAPEWRIGS